MKKSDIEQYRGTFHNGHTSEDVEVVLEPLSEYLGVEVCVAWDFEDMWGAGGNSELLISNGKQYNDAPSDLIEFLYEPGNKVDVVQLKRDLWKRRGRYRGCDTWQEAEHPFNITRRRAIDKELD